jgi:SAM-dependent methyltransferase
MTNTPTNSTSSPTATPSPEAVREQVRTGYAKIAQTGVWLGQQIETPAPSAGSCCTPRAGGAGGGGGGCCGPTTIDAAALARSIGYSIDELDATPEGANLGLSCGNPAAIASLKPGEIVLDLGSGAGFDCFIAAPKVGASGRVIGVDMTPEMLSKARAALPDYARQTGLSNVEFRLGEIENLPVADASVDVVLSNCVLNLSPDKARVWKEIARVLRPGGRVAISDIALLRPLPDAVRTMVEALVGCVSGASLVADIERDTKAAGLRDVRLTPKTDYIEAMVGADDPLYLAILGKLPAGARVADYVTSLDIVAVR